ncbi:MAG: polyprenyl synthetase family protein [Candidatus Kapaibacterium sp.]
MSTPNTIKKISLPVQEHLPEFNKFFKEQMRTDVPLLNIILRYITQRKGKQVRPTIVFLSAELCGGVSRRSYVGATMIELLHTATLVHDDVVDHASERRGLPSINAAWNNKISVLIGDFLLAKGLLTSVTNTEYDFLNATSKAVQRMSEGELLSIEKSRSLDVDEEIYFRIISDKTASLMSSCSEIGALSACNDPEKVGALARYGEMVGIAFQIRDDIFDYVSKSTTIGKPVGNDLKEKKLTLPLVYAFSEAPAKEVRLIKKMIKSGKLKKKDIKEIISFVEDYGGIEYAIDKSREYSAKAVDSLKLFDDSEAKESLKAFAEFVVMRHS